ncbi:hypothetical protein CBS101457_002184 [Exobasidium rhododendri]|nr:hypothetical protein CBS101457_002184 [Exobasidium rhododendri]
MEVLRKMSNLGEKNDLDDREAAISATAFDNEDEEEEIETHTRGVVDIENASTDELMSMLSAEEKMRFKAAIEDQDPSQGKARSLFEKLTQQASTSSTLAGPWWTNDRIRSRRDDTFNSAAIKLASQSSIQRAANIEFNLLAVLLAYAYTVRHLDVKCLDDLHETTATGKKGSKEDSDDMPPLEDAVDEDHRIGAAEATRTTAEGSEDEKSELWQIAKRELNHLCPFLNASGEASKTVLTSVEDVSLWIAGRMDSDASTRPAKTLLFLYGDAAVIIAPPLLTNLSTTTVDRVVMALQDTNDHLTSSSRRKLLFYGAYWLHLAQTVKKDIANQVEAEMKRLQAELDRAEDEERFQAANEAVSRHAVLVPP